MKKDNQLRFLLVSGFYLYIILFWTQLALLGKQVTMIDTPGQAVYIMQTNNLFIVRFIRVFVSSKTGLMEVITRFLNEVSIPYLILFGLWWSLEDKVIRTLQAFSAIIPLVFLIGVFVSLRSQTLLKGIRNAHITGYALIAVSLILALGSLFILVKKHVISN